MVKHSSRYHAAKKGTWQTARQALGATSKIGKKKKYSNPRWKSAMNMASAFGEK